MNCYLLAIGQAGARMCEAVTYACMAGVIPAERVPMVLLCVPQQQRERLERMAQAYDAVRGSMRGGEGGSFAPQVGVWAWPEKEKPASVQVMARSETERLLMRALFTREEAGRDLADGMGGSGPLAALRWAQLLAESGAELDRLLANAAPGDEVILCAGLGEPAGASGARVLTQLLAGRGLRVSLAAYLAVREGDDAGLCRAALRTLNDGDYRAMCLAGLPEDCRDTRPDAPGLCDWMAVLGVEGILRGQTGGMTVRLRADGLDWADFGPAAERWRQGWDGLLQAAALMAGEFGPTAADKLSGPNRLLDRLGWYGAYFGQLRRASAQEREEQAGAIHAAMDLLAAYTAWMGQVLAELPTPLQWSSDMDEAALAAREHYRQITELAGRVALMQHGADQEGMTDEGFVHRYDLSDTPGEQLVKQIAQAQEELAALAEAQDELNAQIGGRMTRSVLAGVVRECAAEADELRAQVEEAARRVGHSAKIATVEQMPRVEAARAKLERLQRHLTVLDGRTARAQQDYERAGEDERRTKAPLLAGAMDPGGKELYDRKRLEALAAVCAAAAAGDRKKLAARVEEAWMWPTPMKTMTEQIARAEQAEGNAAGKLLRAVLALTAQKGAESDAEAMEQRSGVTA